MEGEAGEGGVVGERSDAPPPASNSKMDGCDGKQREERTFGTRGGADYPGNLRQRWSDLVLHIPSSSRAVQDTSRSGALRRRMDICRGSAEADLLGFQRSYVAG